MSRQPVDLASIKALSVEDRIALVYAIWDSIAVDVGAHTPNAEQARELDLRIDELDNNPNHVVTWERIKAFARAHP